MKWQAFTHHGSTYSLRHLDSFVYQVSVPAQKDKPERHYTINVDFSLHCFTRSAKQGETIPNELAYTDSRETRIFDFTRYDLSHQLPLIIQSLAERKCYHDGHGNFYVVEFIEDDGSTTYYSIFFKLSKAGKRKGLNLYVSSAHGREDFPYAKNKKPIRFRVIVHNTHTGKKMRPAS